MTVEPEAPAMAETAAERALEAAHLFVTADRSFIRMRTSKRFNGRQLAAARHRRDEAKNLLVSAVQEWELTR